MTQNVEQLTNNFLIALAAALSHPETTQEALIDLSPGVKYIGRLLGVGPSYFKTWPAGYEMKPRIEVYRDLFESTADLLGSKEFRLASLEYEGDLGLEGTAWQAIGHWALGSIDVLEPADDYAKESAWIRGITAEYYKQSLIHGLCR